MRKLYLASIKFKVGNNEFEETRLVASSEKQIEGVSLDAKIAWNYEANGTDRQLISLTVSDTLTIDKSDQIGDIVKRLNEPSDELVPWSEDEYMLISTICAIFRADQGIHGKKIALDEIRKFQNSRLDQIRKPQTISLEIVCEVFKKTDDSNLKNQYWLREPDGYVVSERPVDGDSFAHYLYEEVKAGKFSIVKN